MQRVGYYNGQIGPLETLSMPLTDRACYFGDGCYDAAYLTHGVIFALEEHLDRFYNSCRLLKIAFPLTRDELKAEMDRVIAQTSPDFSGMFYWQTSRGAAVRGHAFPPVSVKPTLMMFTSPCEMFPMTRDMKLISQEDTRFLHCNIKTLNLLPSVLASQNAVERGCDEAVLHRGPRVTECAHSNILMLSSGVLETPPADELILPGITRAHLLALARENGIPVRERPFSMTELLNADEVIVSSTGALCARVRAIDGIPVGGRDGRTLETLQQAYQQKFLRETGRA